MDIYTPGWVRDAIFYQIFPDRFARSTRVAKPDYLEAWDAPPTLRGYKGGDLFAYPNGGENESTKAIVRQYFFRR